MELCTRFCALFFRLILLVSCFLLFECRKLDGYNFPVYSTKHCPRNETEWNQRSSAINCTEDNGYVCLPNENITELLEFCYTYPFILIQEGICLYLSKQYSIVDSYSCISFSSGCPNSSLVSYHLFKNPECTSIGNGCFLAEPSCQSVTSTIYLPDITEKNRLENSNDWVFIGTTCVVFTITCIVSVLFIKHRKGIRIFKRNRDVEKHEEEKELLPLTSQNQQDTCINESSVEESPLDQVLIKQWQEDNEKFFETKASREVEKLINIKNIVIVAGHSGSGKSAIVHHIALKYRSQDWNVKLVYTVKNMIKIIKSSTSDLNDRTLFVLNDPIGKDSFDEINYTLWRTYEENIKGFFNKTKLLLSCRKYILSDDKVKGLLKEKSNIVDITNDEFKLSNEEKENIWKMYAFDENVSEEEIMEILKTEAYFPLLCNLYFSKKNEINDKVGFFKAPIEVFEEEIRDFRKSSKDKYCALVLLVLFNNELCVEDVRKDVISREKYELALELCEMNKDTAPHTIGIAFDTLQGLFVKKDGNTYQFYHDFVMEVTTYVFGKYYPLLIIKYADIGFLRKRVKLECCNENSDQFIIYLSDSHIETLGKRLFNDIFGERLLDVVLNPCLKNEKVIRIFIDEMKYHPEKLRKLLEKKKLRIDYEDINQTSNQFFFSKISFVSLQERISPLNAIIIFCDTSLSLYCLKALERMPRYFKENSLFSSVCCNGSKDVFAIFIKDHVRDCLSEKWKYLYPIHIASVFNNNEILRELIQVGADVNQKTTNDNYWTPLTLAAGSQAEENEENEKITSAQSRRNEAVELLLSNGADINLCNENRASPLYIACQEGHENIVQLLLSNGADSNLCMKNGASPLSIACQQEHDSIVQSLVNNRSLINSSMEDGTSPLITACQKGHLRTVKTLLNNGANINACKKDGSSSLYTASQEGHYEIVEVLLESGAYINLCKNNGASSLYVACQMGHHRIERLLMKNGADVNLCIEYCTILLYIACEEGQYDNIKTLLNKGADVNVCKKNGASPLYITCEHGHSNIATYLLIHGADINLCKKNGASPLYIACQNGHFLTVLGLLQRKADVNLCKKNGTSPLYVASLEGHSIIVQVLISHGADINLCNKNGESPLYIACQKGHKNVVEEILKKGADINLCKAYGANPLIAACQYKHDTLVKLLLNYGADINFCLVNGTTPLITAWQQGHESTAELLLMNGANINLCMRYGDSPLTTAFEYEKHCTTSTE